MPEPSNLPRARHEAEDVTIRFGILWFAGLAVALGVVIAVAIMLFPNTVSERVGPRLPNFPTPALQASPRADMARFLHAELERLNSTGWVDRDKGIVHIPIADAMRKVAQGGIPGWPTPQEPRK